MQVGPSKIQCPKILNFTLTLEQTCSDYRSLWNVKPARSNLRSNVLPANPGAATANGTLASRLHQFPAPWSLSSAAEMGAFDASKLPKTNSVHDCHIERFGPKVVLKGWSSQPKRSFKIFNQWCCTETFVLVRLNHVPRWNGTASRLPVLGIQNNAGNIRSQIKGEFVTLLRAKDAKERRTVQAKQSCEVEEISEIMWDNVR